MSQTIAVMNAKGGVGKSTVVMALAETLSTFHKKSVLVIDSDSQTSMSIMVMHMSRWEELEKTKRTLVDYLAAVTLAGGQADWRSYVAPRVSDVDEAETVYLIPSHMELSLFEREISERGLQQQLALNVRALLDDAKRYFDVIFVDCPPGISILTETWLRECDFYMPPTKADYLSVRGLAIIERYRDLAPGRRFAQNLGVIINQKDARIRSEEEWHQWLLSDPKNMCFRNAIPRRAYIQRAADFDAGMRTYAAKYPGDAGEAVRALSKELLERLASMPVVAQPAEGAVAQAVPAQTAPVQTQAYSPPAPKPAVPAPSAPVPVQAQAAPRPAPQATAAVQSQAPVQVPATSTPVSTPVVAPAAAAAAATQAAANAVAAATATVAAQSAVAAPAPPILARP
jgi:chromosome partitioning protein